MELGHVGCIWCGLYIGTFNIVWIWIDGFHEKMVRVLAILAALMRFIYQDHTSVAGATGLYLS